MLKHNRNVALTLAEAGCKVFPTVNKEPRTAAWQLDGDAMTPEQRKAIKDEKQAASETGYRHKFVGSTSDPVVIRAMAREYPDATFSIALGPSGLFCLDADLPKEKRPLHGPTELAKLYAENGGKPEGVFVSKSQSGAEHHVFENPNAVPTKGVFANLSIDAKGGGLTADSGTGQIVAPGSIRADGKAYGGRDAAKLFAEARKAGLAKVPDYVEQAIRGDGSQSEGTTTTEATVSARTLSKVSEAEIAALVKVLLATPEPDVSRFDLDALQSKNAKFGDLMLDPPGEQKSLDRLAFLNHVVAAYPDITGPESFALMKANPDVCGTFVKGNQKKGEFEVRNASKDYLTAMREPSAAFDNVVSFDEAYQAKLKPMDEKRAAEMKAKLATAQAEHDATVAKHIAEKALAAEAEAERQPNRLTTIRPRPPSSRRNSNALASCSTASLTCQTLRTIPCRGASSTSPR